MGQIWFWGAGKYLGRIKECLRDNVSIGGIIDRSPELDGTSRYGLRIYQPENALVTKGDLIIVTVVHYESVMQDAAKLQTDQFQNMICFFDGETKPDTAVLQQYVDVVKWELVRENIEIKKKMTELENKLTQVTVRVQNFRYEIPDIVARRDIWYPKIRSAEELLNKLHTGKKSLCRFGDGEFEMIAGRSRPKFQQPDKALGSRLLEILESWDENIIIAIADNYGSLEKYTEHAADSIRFYMADGVRAEHLKLLNPERVYYDAYASRPYILYQDKSAASKIFALWKEIWKCRDILLVEGELTRSGYGNDLFAGANTVSRILAPSEDAWTYYDSILDYIVNHIDKEKLILAALGPTATVLAYDLARRGFQALDIGHIDNEYEWYLRGVIQRVDIAYKYVHEVEQGRTADAVQDETYLHQIIAKIGCGHNVKASFF